MITMETADNALKSFYLDAVTEALDYKTNPFLRRCSVRLRTSWVRT